MEGSLALTPWRLSPVFLNIYLCVRLSSEIKGGVEGGPPWRRALPSLLGDSALCLLLCISVSDYRQRSWEVLREGLHGGEPCPHSLETHPCVYDLVFLCQVIARCHERS